MYADHHLPQSSFCVNSKQVTFITSRERGGSRLFIEFKSYELLASAARDIRNQICRKWIKYIEPIPHGDCNGIRASQNYMFQRVGFNAVAT